MVLGLLVTELVINACKHAFRGRDQGVITVRLDALEDGRQRLTVADDGIGLPAGFEPGASTGVGVRLLQCFVQQLEGTLAREGPPGTRFVVTFPGAADARAA